jgi:hypothetical protein
MQNPKTKHRDKKEKKALARRRAIFTRCFFKRDGVLSDDAKIRGRLPFCESMKGG